MFKVRFNNRQFDNGICLQEYLKKNSFDWANKWESDTLLIKSAKAPNKIESVVRSRFGFLPRYLNFVVFDFICFLHVPY